MERQRNNYIDWIKGICIFMVVLGHCSLLNENVFWFIYRFHMPLFFIISGYLFNNSISIVIFLKNKFRRIIIPYIIFFILSFLINNLLFEKISLKFAIKVFILNGEYLGYIKNYALWYLPTFFVISIIFYYLSKLKSKKLLSLILLLFALITVPTYNFLSNAFDIIPFSIQVIPAGLFFMGIGYIYKNVKLPKINLTIIYIISPILFVLGLLLSIHYNGQILFINSYKYIVSAILIIQFIILITQKCSGKSIEYIGKHSMIILGLHRIILFIIDKYILKTIYIQNPILQLIYSFIISITCIIIILIIHIIFMSIIRIKKRVA